MEFIIAIVTLVLSVFIGGILVLFIAQSKNQQLIKLLLAFSGGFLLSIAFIHFIPELYEHSEHHIGIFILVGFLIQLFLEFLSGGIEHGHISSNGTSKIPFAVVLSLGIHAVLEGIPLGSQMVGAETAISHHHEHDQDYAILLGILFHRLPVAIALMTLLVASKVKRSTSWIIMGIFALTTPVGMLIGMEYENMGDWLNFDIIMAIVVGMFLHISTTIIFETSENHKFNFIKLLAILLGGAVAFLIH